MKKAVILTGKFVQDPEYIYPYYRLQEAGFEVDTAIRNKETVFGVVGSKVVATKDIPEIKVADYDLLVIPGGARCMEYLRQDQDARNFIRAFYETGKTI